MSEAPKANNVFPALASTGNSDVRIAPSGFEGPFGDYFELDIGTEGETQAVCGGGPELHRTGNIWYAHS